MSGKERFQPNTIPTVKISRQSLGLAPVNSNGSDSTLEPLSANKNGKSDNSGPKKCEILLNAPRKKRIQEKQSRSGSSRSSRAPGSSEDLKRNVSGKERCGEKMSATSIPLADPTVKKPKSSLGLPPHSSDDSKGNASWHKRFEERMSPTSIPLADPTVKKPKSSLGVPPHSSDDSKGNASWHKRFEERMGATSIPLADPIGKKSRSSLSLAPGRSNALTTNSSRTDMLEETMISPSEPLAVSTAKKSSGDHIRDNSYYSNNTLAELSTNKNMNIDINNAEKLMQAKRLASNTLERAANISALPSRYFKPSNKSQSKMLNSTVESTLSESDLLLSSINSSCSSSSSVRGEARGSNIGASMQQFSHALLDSDINVSDIVSEFQKVCNTSERYNTESAMERRLLADEMMFKQNELIPFVDVALPSRTNSLPFNSMSGYFMEKSENVSNILPNTQQSARTPIPLVDSTVSSTPKQSLSVSAIARIISDPQTTTITALDLLCKTGKKSDRSSERLSQLPEKSYRTSKSSQCPSSKSSCRSGMKSSQSPPVLDESIPQSSPKSRRSSRAHCDQQRSLKANKENINNPNRVQSEPCKSPVLLRSASSLSSLPNGKLPIESSTGELVWGCVKPGKSVQQQFVVRNRSSKRIKMQLTLSTPSFKILKASSDLESVNNLKLMLFAHEAKSITVIFNPMMVGACADELEFTSLELEQEKKQAIRLYGYGGYGNIEIQQITKDSSGKYILSLGRIEDNQQMSQTFTIRNTGTISAFAIINFLSRDWRFSNIRIEPSSTVLLAKEKRKITITFIPSRDDTKYLHYNAQQVYEIGTLKMVTGSEATRGRIRRLCRIAHEQNLSVSDWSEMLKVPIPGEHIPNDLGVLRESVAFMKELYNQLTTNEVILTLEQDTDQTLVPQFSDDTSRFQTLCVDSLYGINNDDSTVNKERCNVVPDNIVLMPPVKMEDLIFLTSNSATPLHFNVDVIPAGLEVYPKSGEVSSKEKVIINVKCSMKPERNYTVIINVENERFRVSVKNF